MKCHPNYMYESTFSTAIKASEMLVAPWISECFDLPWSALVCYSLLTSSFAPFGRSGRYVCLHHPASPFFFFLLVVYIFCWLFVFSLLLFLCLFVCLVGLFVCLFVWLFVWLFVFFFICTFLHLFVCLFVVSLLVCMNVCFPTFSLYLLL